MTTFIRFSAALSASILFTLLFLALVGSVEHRKSVGVVVLLIIFVGLAVFYSYLKCDLKTAAQRIIGLGGVLVLVITLIIAQVSAGDLFRAGQNMISWRWHKEWGFWSALIAANLLPYLAFNFQTVVLPVMKWIAARD